MDIDSSESDNSMGGENEANEYFDQLMDQGNKGAKVPKPKRGAGVTRLSGPPNFLEYFDAHRVQNEFIKPIDEKGKDLDFIIDSYSSLTDNMKDFPKEFIDRMNTLKTLEKNEQHNKISQLNLFELITELIKIESNVFLYGYGSKLKLIYNFLEYFQENVIIKEENSYHIFVFNCYNPEITFKAILNEIQSYILNVFETQFEMQGIENSISHAKGKTIEDQIQVIKTLIAQLEKKEFCGKFLIVINNIDGPNFTSKLTQHHIGNLTSFTNINILATCDNVNICYLWTQTVKDNLGFYFLKYDTFEQYDVEISDSNGLNGEKGLRNGIGLDEIFKSFSKAQKELLRELAILQLNDDFDKMTLKGIIEYLINKGSGICNNQNRFNELILEALDHELVVKKLCHRNNKEIYRLNLEKDIVKKIAEGEYQ